MTVTTSEVPPGGFDPGEVAARPVLGFLVGRGMIARTVEVAGGTCVELLSAGDLLQPSASEQPSFARMWCTALDSVLGSRRPSVTSALTALGDRDLVTRLPDRSWLLKGSPPEP